MMKVSVINIFPIKSTLRIALPLSEGLPRGLTWYRRWMLLDAEGRFITARHHPTLALVQTDVEDDVLRVSVAGRKTLRLPLKPPDGRLVPVTVWQDSCDAVLAGAEADAWFSDYLGFSCRLVQMSDELVRGVNPDYGQAGDEVSFADGFPLLLISEASLKDLNSRLQTPVSMRRFRPNLVVDGERAYQEDQ